MRELWKNRRHTRKEHVAVSGLFLLFVGLSGCSSWPGQSGGKDSERLTRVIHAENSRLKDLVVQLRSSNEDMAQRSIDDSTRIARLEDENQAFRTSVAAYQSERERMAKSFQNLQQQVQVALSDRSVVTTSSESDPSSLPQSTNLSQNSKVPPAGRFNPSQKSIVIQVDEWFLNDSAILDSTKLGRVKVLAEWLKVRMKNESKVSLLGLEPKSDTLSQASGDLDSQATKSKTDLTKSDLERLRGQRLWESIREHLPKDLVAQIQFDGNPESVSSGAIAKPVPSLLIEF